MPILTDKELIHGCKSGDRKVQNLLYRQYYGIFLKICMRYATDQQDAEQCMNDGFYKIFTRIEQYKHEGSFEGWMKKIMVNTCLDSLKGAANRKMVALDIDDANHDKYPETVTFNDGLHNINFKEVVALIQKLPPVYKIVFNLYVFDGYSHQEIAKELSIREGTSAWYLNKARTQLKQELLFLQPQNLRNEQ